MNSGELAGCRLRLALVVLLWTACFPLIESALPSSPHLTFATMRAGIAGAALLLSGLLLQRPLPASMALWGWIALSGLCATTLGFLGMVHAAEYVSPGLATVIANSQPIAAALIAYFFLGERPGIKAGFGLTLGFSGVAFLAAPGLSTFGMENYVAPGMGYLLLTMLGMAAGNVIMKYLAGSVDAVMATGLQLLIGSIPLAVGAYVLEDMGLVQWSWQFGLALMGIALAGTALPYWLWFSILRQVPLARANAWTFLVAPLGLAVGFAFYGEKLTPLIVGGTALILLGLWLTQGAMPQEIAVRMRDRPSK